MKTTCNAYQQSVGSWQGAHRWVVPARRGCTVGPAPLVGGAPLGRPRSFLLPVLLLALASSCCASCADEEVEEGCNEAELARCQAVSYRCADDSIVAWCDGADPCVSRCADVCADLNARWLGVCEYSATLGHELCRCE